MDGRTAEPRTYGEEMLRFEMDNMGEILSMLKKDVPLDMILCRCSRRKYGKWVVLDCGCPAYRLSKYCCSGCAPEEKADEAKVETKTDEAKGKEKVEETKAAIVNHSPECECGDSPLDITEARCCGSYSELGISDDSYVIFVRTHKADCEFRTSCRSHQR